MVFFQKSNFFLCLFFVVIMSKKIMFSRYSRTKNRLSRPQKKNVQKVEKIDIFPKGLTHGFVPQMAIFPTFFLGNIGQENFFYDILERKNAFLGYKNKTFKSRKINIFPKGLTHSCGPKWPFFQLLFRQI